MQFKRTQFLSLLRFPFGCVCVSLGIFVRFQRIFVFLQLLLYFYCHRSSTGDDKRTQRSLIWKDWGHKIVRTVNNPSYLSVSRSVSQLVGQDGLSFTQLVNWNIPQINLYELYKNTNAHIYKISHIHTVIHMAL